MVNFRRSRVVVLQSNCNFDIGLIHNGALTSLAGEVQRDRQQLAAESSQQLQQNSATLVTNIPARSLVDPFFRCTRVVQLLLQLLL